MTRDDSDPATAAPPAAPRPLRVAIVLLWLEVVGLLGGAGVLVDKTITGRPSDVAGALLGASFAVAAAVLLAFAARGLARLKAVFRSPVVVLQLLALPVAYDLAFQAGRVEYGGPILLVALATLFLLFTPASRAVLDREFGDSRR